MEHLNSTINEALISKWSPLLNAGAKIKSSQIRGTLAQVLENTSVELKRPALLAEHEGSPSAYGVAAGDTNVGMGLPKLVLPVLRRIFPDLMAHELVGVQAMNAPIAFVLALRARLNGGNGWAGIGGDPSTNEIGFGPIDASYTGTPDESNPTRTKSGVFSTISDAFKVQSNVAEDWSKTAGSATADGTDTKLSGMGQFGTPAPSGTLSAKPNGAEGDGITKDTNFVAQHAGVAYAKQQGAGVLDGNRILGVGAPNTPAVQFADIVHGTYPTVNLGLERRSVEAKTRKLGAHWSPELAEDMEVMHNIDVETELVNMLSYEIGAEIDRQILTEMIKLASLNAPEVLDAKNIVGWDQASRVIALLSYVNRIANNIAIETRRGAGNFVVASPKVCALLTMLGVSKYVANGANMPSVPASAVGNLQKVGLINDGQQLLVRDAQAQLDYFLVGYKGTHPGDAGIIYCPYIPVQLTKAIRPDTFTSQLGARTRYGMVSNPLDAAAYYKLVVINNIDSFFFGGNIYQSQSVPTNSPAVGG